MKCINTRATDIRGREPAHAEARAYIRKRCVRVVCRLSHARVNKRGSAACDSGQSTSAVAGRGRKYVREKKGEEEKREEKVLLCSLTWE